MNDILLYIIEELEQAIRIAVITIACSGIECTRDNRNPNCLVQ